jgi:Xaa-Pro aminopeptidase
MDTANLAGLDLKNADALLMVGASERDADLYYATGFLAPDPFVFVWTPTERLLLVSDLELDRARSQSKANRVLAASAYDKRLTRNNSQRPGRDAAIALLLEDLNIKNLKVPADFPLGLADRLRDRGLDLEVAPTPLFSQRQCKDATEIQHIHRALQAAEAGMAAAIDAIRDADINQGTLWLDGQALTAETIRHRIHLALLEAECGARHTIVACGEQGCDPHEEGSGPLLEGQPIIIDIFPQSNRSGYFGDITRTVVKGKAPDRVRQLFEAVQDGQQLALDQVKAGVDGQHIHQAILDLFSGKGYKTGEKDGFRQGFFHGTGHGLGLEIHEAPHISARTDVLQAGQVVTIEPGLYYRGLGGVRLEDVVVVEAEGCRNLTSFPIFLEV